MEDRSQSSPNASMAISEAVVQLLRQYTGRGPTKARTTINTDLVVEVFVLEPAR